MRKLWRGHRTRLGINVLCSSGAPHIYIGWTGGEAAKGAALVGGILLGTPQGSSPPPPTYIYMGRWRLEQTPTIVSRVRCPPPQFTPPVILSRCFGEALRGSLHHHSHHAIMLMELIYYLDNLLDQEGDGCHRAERVQNSEVSYIRYLIHRS